MGKFDGIVLLSDLDGTLLDGQILSDENVSALNYFKENGGRFAPCTGRAIQFIFQHYPQLAPNTFVSATNGAVIFDPIGQNVVWSKPLDVSIYDKFDEIVERFPDHQRITVHTPSSMKVLQGDAASLSNAFQSITDPILKVVFTQSEEMTDIMASYYGVMTDYVYCRSCPVFLEVSALGTGKGASVQRIRELLGKDAATIICVGDYENDISFLRAADIGVAVDGGFEPLKQHAHWVAPPVNQHALAWVIDKIERELV